MSETTPVQKTEPSFNYRLPSDITMKHAAKLSIVDDKPIMMAAKRSRTDAKGSQNTIDSQGQIVQGFALHDPDIEVYRLKLRQLMMDSNVKNTVLIDELSKKDVGALPRLNVAVNSAKMLFAGDFENIERKIQKLKDCRDTAESVIAHIAYKEYGTGRGVSLSTLSDAITAVIDNKTSGKSEPSSSSAVHILNDLTVPSPGPLGR